MSQLPQLDTLLGLGGKRALITGAASGIGKAIAYRYAEAGAQLELVDRDTAGLTKVKSELSAFGDEIYIHTIDLSKRDELHQLWKTLAERLPDILVNNAGIYPFKKFTEVDLEFYERVMDINLHAVYWMCHELITRRGKRGGVIINIGSIEAALPFKEDLAHYSVSKAGVVALTRALAKEYARRGFRVNALLPGGIVTSGTTRAAKQVLTLDVGLVKTGIEFMQRLPAGRLGQPDEVARMALVLASDLASYVHGAAIPVDGGFLSA